MALSTTNGSATLLGVGPKHEQVYHLRVTFKGDALYPGAAGSAGAAAFIKQLVKDRAAQYDLSGSTPPLPANLGKWLDRATIVAYQDLDEDPALAEKVIYSRTADTLVLKARADDALVAAGDKSANTYVALVHIG